MGSSTNDSRKYFLFGTLEHLYPQHCGQIKDTRDARYGTSDSEQILSLDRV
jgi:hypothetical protein